MATSFTSRLDLPSDPAAAYALLSDPDYVREVAQRTGGHDVKVSVTPGDDGEVVIVSARTLHAELPSYARSFVGDRIRLTETRTLGPAADDGSRDGRLEVTVHGAPAHVSGSLRLSGDGSGSALDVDASIRASVPFVGAKVERFVAEQMQRSMAKETTIAADFGR